MLFDDIKAKLRLKEFFTCYSSASFIPQRQVLCHHADFRGAVSHHDSSVTHTWRGRVGVVWGGGLGWSKEPANGSVGRDAQTYRRAFVQVGVRRSTVMGPRVDVADRWIDRPVAMTIHYLGGVGPSLSRSFIVRVYRPVHLRVFFHSVISSSSPRSPSD